MGTTGFVPQTQNAPNLLYFKGNLIILHEIALCAQEIFCISDVFFSLTLCTNLDFQAAEQGWGWWRRMETELSLNPSSLTYKSLIFLRRHSLVWKNQWDEAISTANTVQ